MQRDSKGVWRRWPQVGSGSWSARHPASASPAKTFSRSLGMSPHSCRLPRCVQAPRMPSPVYLPQAETFFVVCYNIHSRQRQTISLLDCRKLNCFLLKDPSTAKTHHSQIRVKKSHCDDVYRPELSERRGIFKLVWRNTYLYWGQPRHFKEKLCILCWTSTSGKESSSVNPVISNTRVLSIL